MNYKEFIINNFEETFPDQYRIYREGDKDIIYYAREDSFVLWNNLEYTDVTEFFKEIFKF